MGLAVLAVTTPILLTSLLKLAYQVLQESPITLGLARLLAGLINTVYGVTWPLTWLWRNAPVPDISNYWTPSNFKLLAVYVVCLLGSIPFNYANQLARRIKAAKNAVDNRRLEDSLTNGKKQRPEDRAPEPDVVPPTTSFWKNPFHLVYLAPLIVTIVGTIVAAVLTKLFGLSP